MGSYFRNNPSPEFGMKTDERDSPKSSRKTPTWVHNSVMGSEKSFRGLCPAYHEGKSLLLGLLNCRQKGLNIHLKAI